jgi:hypothetical protein
VLDVLDRMMLKPVFELSRSKEGGTVASFSLVMRVGNGWIRRRSGC